MDGLRFDEATRIFARGMTRRNVGGLLAAIGLGAGLGRSPKTAAKRKGKKKKKPSRCSRGAILCGGKCVNPRTNALHCGGCGRPCVAVVACVAGQCQGGGCPGDQLLCGDVCVDPETDESHCGRCNNPCADPFTCIGGACDCADGDRCGTECVDLQTDIAHCGSCGIGCGAGTTCQEGECLPSPCGSGEFLCPNLGLCVEENNPNHCCVDQDCENPFGSLECNANGRCVCKNPGEGRCSSATIPARNFLCHVCCPGGDGCPQGQVCNTQENILRCDCDRDNGYLECGDGCTFVMGSDVLNCGRCDNICCFTPEDCAARGQMCDSGVCCTTNGVGCLSGDSCCSGLCTTMARCAACSASQDCRISGQICSGGRCCLPSGGPCFGQRRTNTCCSGLCNLATFRCE